MKLKKLPLLLCVVLMLALMSSVAMAAPVNHDISKGDVVINSCGSSCPGHVISGTTASNTIMVNAGKHNITLDDVSIVLTSPKGPEKMIPLMLFSDANVNLTLKGENKLSGMAAILGFTVDPYHNPTEYTTLTIKESDGSLICVGDSMGILMYDLGIEGGSISVLPSENAVSDEPVGVFTEHNFSMSGGYVDILSGKADGTTSSSTGLFVVSDFTMSGGELTVASGEVEGAYSSTIGIYVGDTMKVNKSYIYAVGSEAEDNNGSQSNGICADVMQIENSYVTGISAATEKTPYSYGILAVDSLNIKNSDVEGYGGETKENAGVCAASVVLSGGAVLNAVGSNASSVTESYGLLIDVSGAKIKSNSCTLVAKGKTAAVKGYESEDPFSEFVCSEKIVATDYDGANNVTYTSHTQLPSLKYLYFGERFDVAFDLNGGKGTVPETKSCLYGAEVPIPSGEGLSKEGYVFMGWQEGTDANFYYEPGDHLIVTGYDVMLYAVWKKPVVNPFTDVQDSDYFYDPVMWAVEEGITSGMTPTTFGPEITCTRAHAVSFLWRMAGEPEPMSSEMPFVDVASDQYYYKAVQWAVEEGITAGTSATTFSPDENCTRGQIVSFLWRYDGEPEPLMETMPFTDVPEGMYYEDPVLWAAYYGITAGITPTMFGPENPCTRGQIVSFLYRYMMP